MNAALKANLEGMFRQKTTDDCAIAIMAERSIDNAYNQALKGVLRILLGFALSPRTRAKVAAFLHRFDEVTDRRVRARDIELLRVDRTIRHWEPVFARARRLLSGLYPDGRTNISMLATNRKSTAAATPESSNHRVVCMDCMVYPSDCNFAHRTRSLAQTPSWSRPEPTPSV